MSAWASQNGVVLGQVKVDGKSNEMTEIPELLKILDIHGCIVSIDAIGTQKEIISTILEQGGDYLLTVKQNQGTLYDQIDLALSIDCKNEFKDTAYDYAKKVEKSHGRIENRECWVTSDPEYIHYVDPEGHWQKLRSLAIVKATRVIEGKTSSQRRYFISSAKSSAVQMMQLIRNHWEVENKLHWSMDVSFNEDNSRVRTGHAPENLALIRKMALNVLRQKKTKWMLCAIDTDFLLEILNP